MSAPMTEAGATGTNPKALPPEKKAKLKICVVGFFGRADEGIHIVNDSIARGLEEKGYQVCRVRFKSLTSLFQVVTKRPDIIHFIMVPTYAGLLASKAIHLLTFRPKIIISALGPRIKYYKFLSALKPDLLLSQSLQTDAYFREIGYDTKIIPNGVDLKKFRPMDQHSKSFYREKYDIPKDKFVMLHNVSFNKKRNIELLEKLLHPDNHILLVGRIGDKTDPSLLENIRKKGFDLRVQRFDNIEELYWLSDCYVFPCKKKNAAILTPLSVLEAMACNVPVISTPFGSVKDLFVERDGFYFANTVSDFKRKIEEIKTSPGPVNTRKQVLRLSWDTIISRIEDSYLELLK